MRVTLVLKGVIACRGYGGIQRQVEWLANAAQPIRRTSTFRVLCGEALA